MGNEYRIGVIINRASVHDQEVVRAISDAATSQRAWAVRVVGSFDCWAPTMHAWEPDGIIASASTESVAETLGEMDAPVVNISNGLTECRFPTICTDDYRVGAMAAEHLLDRNLNHFAYWAGLDTGFSVDREQGFFDTLRGHGITSQCMHGIRQTLDHAWNEGGRELRDWLIRLPKPVGLFACRDGEANLLAEIARKAGLDIPNEIALIGANNDPLLCNLAKPSLTSVGLPFGQIGAGAVQILAGVLTGRPAPTERVLCPPLGVFARGSTDMLAVSDPNIATAVRYIRNHATEGILIDDVLRQVPLGRRTFECKFRDLFGRSPGAEIRRVQLNHAKAALAASDVPMPEVARRSGFCDAAYLSRVFRKETGMTPSHYRRQSRIL